MSDAYYEILGINSDATPEEIKKAYRRLAMEHHPDKGGDAAHFQKIQEAYDCLADDDLRNQYDLDQHQKTNSYNAGFEFMAGGFMDLFRTHLEESIWNSFSRGQHPAAFGGGSCSKPTAVTNIEISLPITLFEVCTGAEKTLDFERTIFVDDAGRTVRSAYLATDICSKCRGTGELVQLINNGFFVHQNAQVCAACEGRGYRMINDCKLTKKKCRFRHNIPIGTLHGETFTFEQDGDILYDKRIRQFVQGNVKITIQYDITETNRILAEIYPFPNISISKVEFGDIYYEYRASVFEFITGTKFNFALPDGRFILARTQTLANPLTLKRFGLPQIVNKMKGRVEIRNVIVEFTKREVAPQMYITESDRIILRRIMAAHYPKTYDEDAIILEF